MARSLHRRGYVGIVMPVRPMAERLRNDPGYAQGMAQDPLLTGGAVINPEDVPGLFAALLRGNFDPESLAEEAITKPARRGIVGASVESEKYIQRWLNNAGLYLNDAFEAIPRELHKPGLVSHEQTFLVDPEQYINSKMYLNKALDPVASLQYYGTHGGGKPLGMASLATSFDPKHGILPKIALMRLLRELGNDAIFKGVGINTGGYSDFTGNLAR